MTQSTNITHTFPVAWESMINAFWNKYPHPNLTHVKDCLVLERSVDEQGILYSKRLICIEQEPPSILKRMNIGSAFNYAIESSTVDLEKKILRLETTNLTFNSHVEAKEVCVYQVEETDKRKTHYTWGLTLTNKTEFPLLGRLVGSALLKRANDNAKKGLLVMEELGHVYKTQL